eukprot:sb/3473582/
MVAEGTRWQSIRSHCMVSSGVEKRCLIPVRVTQNRASSVRQRLEPTETSKQPIRTRYLGHVTGYQPIRDQYFLIRSVPDPHSPSLLHQGLFGRSLLGGRRVVGSRWAEWQGEGILPLLLICLQWRCMLSVEWEKIVTLTSVRERDCYFN